MRGFFGSIAHGKYEAGLGIVCRLTSFLKTELKETGHLDLRLMTENPSIDSLNSILFCVTLNGALNLYAV